MLRRSSFDFGSSRRWHIAPYAEDPTTPITYCNLMLRRSSFDSGDMIPIQIQQFLDIEAYFVQVLEIEAVLHNSAGVLSTRMQRVSIILLLI